MIPTELLKSVVAWFGEYLKNKPFTDLLLVINMLGMFTLAVWMRQDFKDAAAERSAASEKAHVHAREMFKERREEELADRQELIQLITGLEIRVKKSAAKIDAIPEKTAAAVAETSKPVIEDPKQ